MAEPLRDLEALYRAEHARAVGLAVLLTGDRALGEELAQEAFVRMAPHVPTAERPGAYLRTIVINLCRDNGRRDAAARRHPAPVAAVGPAPPQPDDVSTEWEALCELPERQRHVLVLRYWLDLEPADIAPESARWTLSSPKLDQGPGQPPNL